MYMSDMYVNQSIDTSTIRYIFHLNKQQMSFKHYSYNVEIVLSCFINLLLHEH